MIKPIKKLFVVFFLLLFFQQSDGQSIWDKAVKTAKGVKDAAAGVNSASKEVSNTVKNFKQTWKKDTSKNIKYIQVPDYRSRQEVTISKRQKLTVENGEFKDLQWTPANYFDNQVFPSFIIGWASFIGVKDKDIGSSLGFDIRSSLSNVTMKWEIECVDKNYFNIDSGFIEYHQANSLLEFRPKISWNFRTLTKQQTSTPVGIHFRLIDPVSGNKVEKLATINLRSINDCLLKYDGKYYDYMFASYVNEDANTELDKILQETLNTKMVPAIVGYQWGDQYVELQIAAIWRVLHDRGFKYSSITDNSGDNNQKLFSQTVRTFDNAVKTSQANCVDGTVVFASILKRIGIRPVLVSVPGHCFLGYFSNASDTEYSKLKFLETTMLSWDNYILKPNETTLPKYKAILSDYYPSDYLKTATLKNKAYFLQFELARQSGDKKWKDNNDKYGSIANKVKVHDVTELRKSIKPIPIYD